LTVGRPFARKLLEFFEKSGLDLPHAQAVIPGGELDRGITLQ
jgi:hypothetical protein